MSHAIQTHLDALANRCLNENKHQSYTDKDLTNATIIFSHILLDVIFTVNVKNLSQESLEEVADNAGKMIRVLIASTTNKDMHEIVKN